MEQEYKVIRLDYDQHSGSDFFYSAQRRCSELEKKGWKLIDFSIKVSGKGLILIFGKKKDEYDTYETYDIYDPSDCYLDPEEYPDYYWEDLDD